MLIVCDSCGAEYEVDVGDEDELGEDAMRFRCSACGHTFTVGEDGTSSALSSLPDDWQADAAPAEPVETEPPMLLKQEGKVYQVEDVATLQRWIVERRVLREDLLSIGGLKWEPVGSRRDLQVFFQLVESVEESDGSTGMGAPPVEGVDSARAVKGAAPWEMGEPGLEPSPAEASLLDAFAAPEADDDEWEDDDGTDAGLPVFGAPPVLAAGPDPTDLPDVPTLAAADAVRNLADEPGVTRGERVELPGGDVDDDGPSVSARSEDSVASAVSAASAGSAASGAAAGDTAASDTAAGDALDPGDPYSAGSGRLAPFQVIGDPDGSSLREEQATEEIARPLPDDLTDDMLFPEERKSEEFFPVPAGGAETSARQTSWPPPEPEPVDPGGGGVPTWMVVAGAVAALVAVVWFLGRGDGAADAPASGEPASDAAHTAPADPPVLAPGQGGGSSGGPALMPAPGTELPGEAGSAPKEGQGDASADAAGPASGTDADPPALDAAAQEAAAQEAAAKEAAAKEAAAKEAASKEAAAKEAAAKEAAAKEAAAKQAAAKAAPTEAAAARPVSVKRMVDQGWAAVERGDLSGARATFNDALQRDPGNADARFGLGYAYEKLGNETAAVRNYCQVAATGSGDARIEAQGRLRALEASCE
ncbi:MAG: zinc-ribbon domain-containing protein [Alphaproteobacteria bacterium]|nr:zinc-ribbon domain-containing protein [Alphaproteobacteria bacterium]